MGSGVRPARSNRSKRRSRASLPALARHEGGSDERAQERQTVLRVDRVAIVDTKGEVKVDVEKRIKALEERVTHLEDELKKAHEEAAQARAATTASPSAPANAAAHEEGGRSAADTAPAKAGRRVPSPSRTRDPLDSTLDRF